MILSNNSNYDSELLAFEVLEVFEDFDAFEAFGDFSLSDDVAPFAALFETLSLLWLFLRPLLYESSQISS